MAYEEQMRQMIIVTTGGNRTFPETFRVLEVLENHFGAPASRNG